MVDKELIAKILIQRNVDELLERLVSFSILMENNEGIVAKSPSYILEKFEICMLEIKPENPLDNWNKQKFGKWRSKWK